MNLNKTKIAITPAISIIICLLNVVAAENIEKQLHEIYSELGFSEIVLVERHAIHSSHVYTYHEEDNKPGGGLFIFDLNSNSKKKILDSKDGLILDANLHYNRTTILFSWKKEMTDYFQLYTIEKDGKNIKQLTHQLIACS